MSYIPRVGWRGRFLPAGVGDVLNPTAGTSLDCGLFAGGVFKPECWAKTLGPTKLFGKTIVSQDDYRAAYALAHPELAYPAMPLPVPPPAVSAGTSTVPAPYTAAEYAEAVDAAVAEGARRTRAAAQSYFESTAAAEDAIIAGDDGSPDGTGSSWWLWALLGGLVVVGLAVTGRRR